MSATDPAYQLRNLLHSYGNGPAIDVPDLTLEAGAVHAVLGPNGSGKSTLLHVLALLLPPSSGEVEILGARAYPRRTNGHGLLALRQQVTLIHQRPVLLSRDVAGNVAFGLRARGLARDDVQRRVAHALARVGLAGFERRRELSGGEVQRVVIARAMVLSTPILLLDEPLSYLDEDARPLLVDLIDERRAAGATVVLATHDAGFADSLADRRLLLRKGRLE
ncbi:MAG: ABC transporter ATP-binding protein [Myxococcota bacterium]|jgi:energy-coupling factor transporter ATP-binding protein EcfA2|nr:ABC transporter ATP-binding protein [Myxococcota bacterium]